jgi:hypothetical protein
MNTKLSGEERIDSCLSTLGEPMSKGNSMFEDFWKVWPSNPRKGAKSKCKQVWIKSYCDTQADQIIKHVQWLKTTEQWLKSNGAFIPAPLVYLNQQRWDGAEIPEIKRTETALEAIEQSRKSSVPMPDDIKAKLAALRGRT